MDKIKISGRLVEKVLILSLFAAILLFYSSPIGHSDFWWHIATGKHILEHGEIPSEDPFTYTSESGEDSRKSLILRGYWLAQVFYFFIYGIAGFEGLVVLKAGLFVLIFYMLWRILKRKAIDNATVLFTISLLAIFLKPFDEVRPQVFSFLGILLVFERVETALDDLRQRIPLRIPTLVSVPIIMLLWSNIHPGYVLGLISMIIITAVETLKFLLKKNALSGKSLIIFLLWITVSFGASAINPAGWIPAFSALIDYRSAVLAMTIDEYLPPWKYASYTGFQSALYGPLTIVIITLIPLVIAWRRLCLSHVLLYAGFAYAGFASFRYMAFYMLMAVTISGRYVSERMTKLIRPFMVPAVFIGVAVLVMFGIRDTSLTRGALKSRLLPDRAAEFIINYDLPAPVFNPYEWSGYLVWKLYPSYRLFVDSRTLDFDIHIKYMAARMGTKDKVFDEYDINTVLFYPIKTRTYRVPGIIFSLLKDDRWNLTYIDELSVIFVRVGSKPRLPVYPKEVLWNSLIKTGEMWVNNPPGMADPYRFLGEVYRARGDEKRAREYFNRVSR